MADATDQISNMTDDFTTLMLKYDEQLGMRYMFFKIRLLVCNAQLICVLEQVLSVEKEKHSVEERLKTLAEEKHRKDKEFKELSADLNATIKEYKVGIIVSPPPHTMPLAAVTFSAFLVRQIRGPYQTNCMQL